MAARREPSLKRQRERAAQSSAMDPAVQVSESGVPVPQQPSLTKRIWLSLVMFGLFGQIAWVINNVYFNVFMYRTVTHDPQAVAYLVAVSAVVAAATTLGIGVLSDKIGRRKPFIVGGYCIWGLTIAAFAFITVANTARLFPSLDPVRGTVWIIVVMAAVMTFFGSTANDAAFNSWVTDVTVPSTRGRADGVLSALPLLALLIVFGGLDALTQNGQWTPFFFITGGLVTVGGLLGMFIIQDAPNVPTTKPDILYGFKPAIWRENSTLYIVFILMAVFFMAMQIFFPFWIIYLDYGLGISDYALILAVILIGSAIVSVLGGRVVDKYGRAKFFFPFGILFTVGAFLMYLHGRFIHTSENHHIVILAIFAIIMMSGNLLMTMSLNATARDYMPEAKRGLFNGVRMIFFVLIPMVGGPFIGARIIAGGATYVDEFGDIQSVPNPEIFLGTAVVSLFMFIPMWFVVRALKSRPPVSNTPATEVEALAPEVPHA